MMTIKTENWLGEFVSTIGTGDAILGGAIDGFAGFSNVGNDVDVYYTIIDGLDKETGIGTLSAGRLIRKEIHATLVSGIYVKNGSPLNLSGDAQIYGTANSKFLSDVYAFMAVAEGNTRLIKNIQELQINGHPLTASFNLTADDVEAVSKAGDTMTGNLFTPAVLVSSAQNASPNALTRKDYVDSQVATRAPTAHTHTWDQVTSKPTTFTPSAHTHPWSEITSKPATFPPSSHTHPWGEVTGAPATATRWPEWSEVTSKPSTFTPSAHTHTAAQGNADIVAGSHSQIGTYMLAQSRANTVQTPGYTVAGSSLRPASAGDRYVDGQSLAGTWKLLGAIWDESNQVANRTSLWIRIS